MFWDKIDYAVNQQIIPLIWGDLPFRIKYNCAIIDDVISSITAIRSILDQI